MFHATKFKKFKLVMRSKVYKPDAAEQPHAQAALRHIFPSDVKKNPHLYVDSAVHWIGIVRDVHISDSNGLSIVLFTLEQHYWDYIEDYSVQDEVMFLSPLGEGEFHLLLQLRLTPGEKEALQKMPDAQTLFFCYGKIIPDDVLPAMRAAYIKMVDYKYYSTKIFSYDVKRDASGAVVLSTGGQPVLDNFKMLRVARPGQNKQ